MLKRQRPSTPPIPSLPLSDELSPLDALVMEREYKRRRTTSITPLDDHWKGRASSPRLVASQSGNSKEDTQISEDSQYKSANNVLRELHTLHQHRLLFAGPPPSHAVPFQSSKPDHLEYSKQTYFEPESTCRHEQNLVKERYVDTNRLLGSTFLSRRRQLGLDEQYPG